MCRPATCKTCGKASWAGCGQHVDQVLRGVPRNGRCSCPPGARSTGGKGVFARLFGR